MISEENQRTIWMNVTTSRNWHRPTVGIVRVERELRDNLRNLYPPGQFKECFWQDSGFVEVEDSASAVPVDASNALVKGESPTDAPAYLLPVIARRYAVISIAKGVFSLTPIPLRPILDRVLRKLKGLAVRVINWRAARLARRGELVLAMPAACELSKISATSESDSKARFSHPFKPGDIFISVGLDWDWPYYKHFYFLRTRENVKIVTMCHDLIPILFPQYCVPNVASIFLPYFIDIAEGSDLVLCNSLQTEKDFHDMLENVGGRNVGTHVFPLGDNVVQSGDGEISPQIESIASQPFILFVSSIERRKNHEVLYRAYHMLCEQGRHSDLPKLVFVGMPGWGVGDLLKDIELDPLTKDLIVQLNHVSDDELLALYRSALFCVYPSLYEGWGLPVGEALSLGKAVLCSNRGSLIEVGAELVVYIDPWNPGAWADQIYRLSTNAQEREMLEARVKSQYQMRHWTVAANSVHLALETLNQQ